MMIEEEEGARLCKVRGGVEVTGRGKQPMGIVTAPEVEGDGKAGK